MYGGVALFGLIESLVPGQSPTLITYSVIGLAISALLLLCGPRVPRASLCALGPVSVALAAYSLAHTRGSGDTAVMYVWPMLWTAHFFGRTATAVVVTAIGVANALALGALTATGAHVSRSPVPADATRWIEVMVSMTVIAVVVRTLTENNQRLLVRLAAEARTDPLTGLLNRRGLTERAAAEFARAAREQSPVSVIALDIDHFKLVNDEHGHETGDHVLKLIGAMLREQARGSDIAARIGGEEFLIVLPGRDEHQALVAAERARSHTAKVEVSGVPTVTLSAGVAATRQATDLESLIAEADHALYLAKQMGRDRAVVAPHDSSAESRGAR
jgi:diguanylate cyclase (GGDEF)-like protein